MPNVKEKSNVAPQMKAIMATNSASFDNDFGRQQQAVVPGLKVDLIPRIQSGKYYGILSQKQRMMMRLAEEEAKGPPNIPDGDDFEDAIEGARREREPSRPPLAIQFPTTTNDDDDDANDYAGAFPILSSPSSISWHTFKKNGNDPPWRGCQSTNKAVKEVGADRGDDVEKAFSTAASNHWTEEPVMPEHLTEELVISMFGQENNNNNDDFGQRSRSIMTGPEEEEEDEPRESLISGFEQEKKKKKNDVFGQRSRSKEEEDERRARKLRVNEDVMEAVMAPSATATVSRTVITNKKEEEKTNKEDMEPQVRKGVTTTTSKERRTTNDSGRRSNNNSISSTSATTTPKKERVGFASRMLKKKTPLSTFRRNKDPASSINNKKASPLTASTTTHDDDDDEESNALLGGAHAANNNARSSSREKSNILNLRQRVRMLGKSRQSKSKPNDAVRLTTGGKQKQQQLGKIKEEPEVRPATPVKKKSNNENAVDKIKEEVPEEVVTEQQAAPSTPIKKKSNNDDDDDCSFRMTMIVVTPVNVILGDTTHPDTLEKQAGKGGNDGRPAATGTPTTTASAASSWNLSPHYDTSPRNGGTRKVQDADDNGHPMMLPPAMPPSMVSCETMDDDDGTVGSNSELSKATTTADDEQSQKTGISKRSSNNGFQKQDPPETFFEIKNDPPGTFERVLPRGLSTALSEEGYENPSVYTIPNPMPFSSPSWAAVEQIVAENPQEVVDEETNAQEEEEDGDLVQIENSDKRSAFASSKPKKIGDIDDCNIDYNNEDHGIIGPSTDVFVEVSSTTQGEGEEEAAFCEDIEVIKCMGMEDIGLENIHSRDNNDDANNVNGDEVEDEVEQDSLKQSSKTTKESETTKENAKTQESEETHNDAPSAKLQRATHGRGRLGRSKIRAAAMSTMMNVRNNNNNDNGGEGNRNRSKSRDAKHRNRSKPRDNGGRTRSKSISMRTRKFRKKKQVNGADKSSGKKSENNNDAVASSSGTIARTTKTKGLSNDANEALAWKEENPHSPAALREMEQLVITPVSTPILGSHIKKGYRSLSQHAQADLAGDEEALELELEEIEVSFGIGGGDGHSDVKKMRRESKIMVSKKQQLQQHVRGSRSRSAARSEKSSLGTRDYTSDYTSEEESSYESHDDDESTYGDQEEDDDSEYYDDDDDDPTVSEDDESCSFVSDDDDESGSSVSDDDDESGSFVSRKSSYSQESDDATTYAGFQEEIMEDLHDAFVDTTAHITQMMNVFDIVEVPRNIRREERRASRAAAKKNASSRGGEKNKSSGKKRGESGQRRHTRPRISNEHDRHSDDRRIGSGEKQHQQRRARGGRSDEKKNKENNSTAKRSSRFRNMEL